MTLLTVGFPFFSSLLSCAESSDGEGVGHFAPPSLQMLWNVRGTPASPMAPPPGFLLRAPPMPRASDASQCAGVGATDAGAWQGWPGLRGLLPASPWGVGDRETSPPLLSPLTGRAPPAALRAAPGSWGALLSKMTSVLKSSTLRISGGTMFHRSSCPTYELGGASRAPWRHRAVSLPVMTSALPGGGSRRFRPPRPFPSFSAVQAQRRACTAHLPAELDRWAAGCV